MTNKLPYIIFNSQYDTNMKNTPFKEKGRHVTLKDRGLN